MRIIVTKNYEDMSKEAANLVKTVIRSKDRPILGLATGSTPIGLYNELIEAYKTEDLDFSSVITFNLDEYLGIDPEHPSSYNFFMHDKLFDHINIKEENIHIPDGLIEDIEAFSKAYEQTIDDAGGIDVQILGVGENGHIAFNEPGETLSAVTFIENLTEDTITVNSRFFKRIEEVPTKAVSMGMGTIMKAKQIILLANGERKRPVIEKLLADNSISTHFPISFLKAHPNATIIVDEAAYPLED